MSYPAKIYYSLEQLIEECSDNPKSETYWIVKWKQHIDKKGNVPLIIKCAICSGKERLRDIKHGTFKVSTRVSQRQKEEFED